MRWGLAAAIVWVSVGAAPGQAMAALTGCDAFIEKLRAGASDMQVAFTHSLVVSHSKTDANVFDITTNAEVDATLTCRGDEFSRFEARVVEPASARVTTSFERFEAASLRAALGWDAGHSRGVLKGMNADAREFLAASKERGDVYVAGKTEEHLPGSVSLGLIFTETDRAFIIVGPGS